AAAIADEHFSMTIEGEPRGDAQLSCKHDNFLQRSDAIEGPVEPAGDEHTSSSIEGDAGRIDNIAGELFDISIRADSIERYRHVLAARTRFRHKQRAVSGIESRVRNRMNVARQLSAG